MLNIVLDPILIFGLGPIPAFGLEGAAIATNIGRGVGVLYQLWHLAKGSRTLTIKASHLVVKLKTVVQLFRLSLGGTGQFFIGTASWIFLMRIMANFGDDALAGYTIAIRIVVFTILPSWGISNAAATLMGQNLGAKQPDRAEKSVWITAGYNTVFLGLVSVVFFVAAPRLVGFFTTDPNVLAYGAECLQVVSLGYVFCTSGMVIGQALNGAGDTLTPTLINFVCYWLIEIPVAYMFALYFGLGPKGVYVALVCSLTCLAVVSVLVFRRGRWKTVRV